MGSVGEWESGRVGEWEHLSNIFLLKSLFFPKFFQRFLLKSLLFIFVCFVGGTTIKNYLLYSFIIYVIFFWSGHHYCFFWGGVGHHLLFIFLRGGISKFFIYLYFIYVFFWGGHHQNYFCFNLLFILLFFYSFFVFLGATIKNYVSYLFII